MPIECKQCGLKNVFLDHDFVDSERQRLNCKAYFLTMRKFTCDDCGYTWNKSWEELGLVDYTKEVLASNIDKGKMVIIKSPTSNTYFICATKTQLERFYTPRRETITDSTDLFSDRLDLVFNYSKK
jgi:hypothetical protein